jgi:hypothetical protein
MQNHLNMVMKDMIGDMLYLTLCHANKRSYLPGKCEVVHGAPHASTHVGGILISSTAAPPKFSNYISNFFSVHLHGTSTVASALGKELVHPLK